MASKKVVSIRVIRRISVYYEALLKLDLPETAYVSSKKLEEMTGLSSNQVRQDFFYLSLTIGKQKKGYMVKKLMHELKRILSIDRGAKIVVIGAGRIGQSFSAYRLFQGRNIQVAAMFDINPDLIGTSLGKPGAEIPILAIDELEPFLRGHPEVEIALLAVPEEVAQELLDRLVSYGIKGVVNYAPRILRLPREAKGVQLINESICSAIYKMVYHRNHPQ